MNKELTGIDFEESVRVIRRVQERHRAGKRIGRKDRAIVSLLGLLKQANARVEDREKEMTLMTRVGRGGANTPWQEMALMTRVPSAVTHVVGLVPRDLLNRIETFADSLAQAALVAQNGVLVGEARALLLLGNDFRRCFSRELEEDDDDRD